MREPDKISRLSRLTAILLKLQSRPYINVNQLSEHFGVSTRTIYRDLLSLEASGVPILSVEGKGYALVEGYNIPPVMFTESEANALIIAEKLIAKTKDQSLITEFHKATEKVKSVLKNTEKEKVDFLSDRIIIGKNWENTTTSAHLSLIQEALTNFRPLKIKYQKEAQIKSTQRTVEPFAIYHNTSENWILIAWCRLRKDFRSFRVDRIQTIHALHESFTPHKMTLAEYVNLQKLKHQKLD